MDMKGEYRIPLPQETVWRALNDPEVLKGAIPGCEELVRESDTRFKGRIFASVGPVKARFGGEATLSDIDPPNGYTLTGSGSGGPAGMAKGSAIVRLRSEGAETILEYEVKAQVAGKLAQIGARLVDMAAKKMADDFFGNFVRLLAPAPVITAAAPPGMPEFESSATVPETGFPQRSSWLGWAAAVILVAIVVIAFLWTRFG